MNKTLLSVWLLFAVILILTAWTEGRSKHHRHHHLKNIVSRHKVAKHEPERKVEEKTEDKEEEKTEEDVSGSGLMFADEPEDERKEDELETREENTKENEEKDEEHESHKRSKKRKKLHDQDEEDQGSLRNLLDSSIENLAKAGKAIQAILDATGTKKVSQTCAGSCPDVCAPGCQSTCCNPVDSMSQVAGQYPSPYQQSPYPYPQQQQYAQVPQYPQVPQVPQAQPAVQYPQQPGAQQCPQQCSAIPCPSTCLSTCCSAQPQYPPQAPQPAGGVMGAPQFLVLPPAKQKPNNTQPTQPSSCASPCAQTCAPACDPSCCSASMGMPMGMPYPQQQPMMPVMPQMPQMQQQACPQACQPTVPGGCAPQAQCPQRCCQNGRR